MSHAKKKESMAPTQESYQLVERQTLGLLDNQLFRSTVLNPFKEF